MYGKLVSGTLELAPRKLVITVNGITAQIINPTSVHYAIAGYKSVTYDIIPEGYYVVSESYAETSSGITVSYITEAISTEPTLEDRLETVETDVETISSVIDEMLFAE